MSPVVLSSEPLITTQEQVEVQTQSQPHPEVQSDPLSTSITESKSLKSSFQENNISLDSKKEISEERSESIEKEIVTVDKPEEKIVIQNDIM